VVNYGDGVRTECGMVEMWIEKRKTFIIQEYVHECDADTVTAIGF